MEAIIVAARAGVKVELLVPRIIDVRVVALASARYIERCVSAGVEVYRYGGGFLHSKTIVIDDGVVIIGSANIDYRSLYYNMEASAIVYNRKVATDYASRFYADVALSERVSVEAPISLPSLLAQGLARLLAPIL
jgi:cardiolipin synthase